MQCPMTSAPRHDDRKGRHYYIRMRRPAKPSYSSDDPCGRHEGALVMVLGARHGAGALVMGVRETGHHGGVVQPSRGFPFSGPSRWILTNVFPVCL